MADGVVSAFLVLAGGMCAITGYFFGELRQRRALAAKMEREARSERLMDDGFADPTAVGDERLN